MIHAPTGNRCRLIPAAALTCALGLAGLANPGRADAQSEVERPRTSAATTAGLDYSYAYFQGDIDPWHFLAASVGRRGRTGSIIGRVNLANRFASNGAQVELDAYPGLGEGTYGYLNVGYSQSTIFPDWRFGGELFRSLPRAWEGSLGFRQLRFGGAPITLFTGSVGKYAGNYWFSLRPYVRDKDTGLSASMSLTTRRYYADADSYLGFRVGYGSSPGDQLTAEELTRTNSTTLGVQGSRTIRARRIGTWSVTYDREELLPNKFRNRWELSGGVKIEF